MKDPASQADPDLIMASSRVRIDPLIAELQQQ